MPEDSRNQEDNRSISYEKAAVKSEEKADAVVEAIASLNPPVSLAGRVRSALQLEHVDWPWRIAGMLLPWACILSPFIYRKLMTIGLVPAFVRPITTGIPIILFHLAVIVSWGVYSLSTSPKPSRPREVAQGVSWGIGSLFIVVGPYILILLARLGY